jgi:uncharacterized protein involved in exopolysaccharide biosynthesis
MWMTFLRRNLLLIAIPAIVVPLLSIVLVARDGSSYEGRAKIFFSRYQVASNVVVPQPSTLDPLSEAQSQAELAQIPLVVRRALRAAGVGSSESDVDSFLRRNKVAAGSGLVTFIVADSDRATAERLATEWARASLAVRRSVDSRPLARALRAIRARLRDLRAAGGERSVTYQSLIDKQVQLETLQSLQLANGALVQPAPRAERAGAGPVKTVVFAFIGGLALGLALALAREALQRDEPPPPRPPYSRTQRDYERLPETVDA